MATAVGYPIHVEGRLDAGLSRWLWLVKWFLAIPHYVVLAFLWVGFVVTSVVAFFAILLTGRYPRVLFDFNVGVLRWTWRVSYYTYGALATDRYPPFTLDDVSDYPARLDVAYPAHLSRGLVLVKWWLLALPHYLVVGLLLGGAYIGWQPGGWDGPQASTGLIGLLVLVAAVVLAVTGRYPRGLYDVVLGLNRWVLRVAVYAGLMTDQYPPFRLDMGGSEPPAMSMAGGVGTSADDATSPPEGRSAPVDVPTPPGPPRTQLGAGRVVALVLAALVALVASGLLLGGAVTLLVDRTQRDADGLLRSDQQTLVTDTSALVSDGLQVDLAGIDTLYVDRLLGDVELRVTSAAATPVFVGVAEQSSAAAYLDRFARAEVTRIGGGEVTYATAGSGVAETPPASETLWTQTAAGIGTQTLTWEPASGNWVVVVMNADGSPGVDVRADVGADLPVLGWVAAGLLAGGGVLLLFSAATFVAAVRR